MTEGLNRRAIMITSLVWLGVILAAGSAALVRGVNGFDLLPIILVASFPAILALSVMRWGKREWAQILIIVGWMSLAIIGSVFVDMIPMVVLFLAAPVIAGLFQQEKIVESLVISGLLAICFYFASAAGVLPVSPLSGMQTLWAKQVSVIGVPALVISALFVRSQRLDSQTYRSVDAQIDASNNVYESLRGCVMRFDKEGKLLLANSESENLFDLDLMDKRLTIHALIKEKFFDSDVLKDTIQRSIYNNREESVQFKSFVGNVTRSFESYIFPQRDGGIVLHAIDRTDQEIKVEKLRQAQLVLSNEAEDNTLFFAGVSHELRTPLNAIIGFSDMMRSRLFGPLPSKYAEYADMIHDSGQHMLDLIGDVLDLSKVQAGKYELQYDKFDASDVIGSSVKMVRPSADAAKIGFDVAIKEDEIIINADRKALRQILLNLLSNAVKFSKEGDAVTVSAYKDRKALYVEVSDTGVGMDAEDLLTIGTPYKQSTSGLVSEERGSGLGLTLVKSLVDLHGGEFSIESEVDKGTNVKLSLPLKRF